MKYIIFLFVFSIFLYANCCTQLGMEYGGTKESKKLPGAYCGETTPEPTSRCEGTIAFKWNMAFSEYDDEGNHCGANNSEYLMLPYLIYEIKVENICYCTKPNQPFPDLNQTTQEVAFTWSKPEDRTTECTVDLNGTVEEEIMNCNSTYRCVVEKGCNEEDEKLPKLATNQQLLLTWKEGEDKSQTCLDLNGTVQEGKENCKAIYQCVKKTDSTPNICNEHISSYVTPRDGAFHEDIALDGLSFGLHYRSLNSEKVESFAKGWSLSNHHHYINGRFYRGDGTILASLFLTTEGNQILFHSGREIIVFDASLKHIETRDAYTQKVLFTFIYEEDKLVAIVDAFAKTTTLEYDANGVLTSITAPYGQTTAFGINSNHDLLEVQYEDGSSYTFEYEKHLMTKETEPNGNEFLHIFNDAGEVTKVIDAEQGEWSFTNSPSFIGSTSVLRASGDRTSYTRSSVKDGKLEFKTHLPTGDIITTLKAVDDSQESRASCGMRTTKIYKTTPNAGVEFDVFTHRRIPKTVTTVTPSGLKKETLIDKHFYHEGGTPNKIVLKSTTNGKLTESIRDYKNHTATQTTAEGKVNRVQYGEDDRLVQWSKAYGLHKTLYSYDSEGRVIQVKQGNRKVHYSYNTKGNLASTKDAKGRVTRYEYDSRDRLVKTIYPNGNTIQHSYDKNGNMTTLTTPTPSDHTFAYNGVNKRVSMSSPLHATTIYTYDKARRVTKITRPSGKTIKKSYKNERLISTTTAEGTTNYSYACQGNVASKTKGSESITYAYDGTLLTKVTESGQLNQTLNMSYNNDFLLNSFSYAGATTNYSYNQDNEAVKVGSYDIVRTKENRKVKVTDGRYKQIKRFNKYGELTKLKDKRSLVKLSYNKNGQIVKKVEKIGKRRVVYHYTYDKLSRLIKVKKGRSVVERYTYDKNGNRKTAKVYGRRINTSYTLDDQLEVYGDNTYRYDNDGYLKEKTTPNGITTYEYGTLGELRKVVTPTKTIEYLHNADNQRVAKKVDGTVVEKYLWVNLTTLLAVYDGDDNLKQRFEYVDNRMPISMTMNNKKYYLHYDQVGTLKAISNSKQRVIKKITYDSYGNILNETNQAFNVPFGFAGGLYDSDTKLTRFGYRDYDAYTGKWTAKDPIDFGGGDSNLYGYVLQDPVSGIDPSGLVDANSIDWDYNIKNTGHGFFDPLISFTQNILIGMHGYYYDNDSAFTILGHGYKGWSTSDEFYKKLARDAENSGKEYIELDICEIGQDEYGKDLPQKLHDLSGLPVKFTEDYVVLPPFGRGQPSLENSETARIHGWQWLR